MMDISSKIHANARCTRAGEFDRGQGGGMGEGGEEVKSAQMSVCQVTSCSCFSYNCYLTIASMLWMIDIYSTDACHIRNISKVNVTLLYLVTLTSESMNNTTCINYSYAF